MKIICTSVSHSEEYISIGRKYEVEDDQLSLIYLLDGDNGEKLVRNKGYFIKVTDLRKNKINKIFSL